MLSSIWSYIALALGAIVLGLFIMLRISWGNVETLQAEKITLQHDLDLVKADLKISIENHNRIVSEKNRMMAAERDRAQAEQSAAVNSARIAKDIEYATDGKGCVGSDPVQRLLRGLWNAEQHGGPGSALNPVSNAGRSGATATVPRAARSD